MSWGLSPWVYPFWGSLGFLDLGDYFLPHFREVFNYYLLKYFLMVFLFVFFWDSYDLNVGAFNIVPEVSEVVLISLNSFFLSDSFISTILSSTLLIFCLHYSTVGSLQSVFLSHLLHYSLYIDFFISSRSLLNLSCIFSILNSNLYSRFWIVFTIIILNSLSGRFPISSSLDWFGGIYPVPFSAGHFSAFSSCLCCCAWGSLSVVWQSVVPLYCGGSSLWVGLDGWLVKVSWLGKLVSVFWWVELNFFSLECNEVSSNEF